MAILHTVRSDTHQCTRTCTHAKHNHRRCANISLSVLAGGCLPRWCLPSLFQDPFHVSICTHTHTRTWKACFKMTKASSDLWFFGHLDLIFGSRMAPSPSSLQPYTLLQSRRQESVRAAERQCVSQRVCECTNKKKNRWGISRPARRQQLNFNKSHFSSDGEGSI